MRLLLKSPSISHLFRSSCPSNVATFIIPVVINSINRMKRRWRITNILVKRWKIVAPFFANRYAASAVIFELFRLWIVASGFYRTPCSKNFGTCFSMDEMSLTKNGIGVVQKLSAILFSKTSTGDSVSCSKISSVNPSTVPAFTYAKPITLFRMTRSFPTLKLIGDGQATESSTC